MNLPAHLSANTIAVIPLKYFLHWDWQQAILFIVLAFLLDLDHIFFFIFKTKSLKPNQWLKIGRAMRANMEPGFYIFHSPEFNIVLLSLSFFNKIFLIFFLASLLHIMLDSLEHYRYHKNFSWFKKWSMIYKIKTSLSKTRMFGSIRL